MTTTLKPAPVSILQFSYDSTSRTFTAEISSTNGLGRVYADSVDAGLTVVGTRLEVVFVVEEEHRNEGDVTHWTLRSVDGQYSMVLFND